MPVAVMTAWAPSLGDGGRLTHMRDGQGCMSGVSLWLLALAAKLYASITA